MEEDFINIERLIYVNLVPFLGLIGLLLIDNLNYVFDKKQSRLFKTAVIINIIAMAAVSLDDVLRQSSFPDVWIFRRITSCINFGASPLIPVMLYRIFKRDKCSGIYYLPCLLNIFLCVVSMFTGSIFFISENNKYGRGSLFFIPFAISIFYLIVLIVKMGVFNRKNNRSEQIFLSLTIGALMLCMYLEIARRFILLDWACVAISLILYYLLINVNNAILDPLTEAYNRAMYMKRLSEISGALKSTIGLIDINNFKQVNDEYGHDAGDRYLIKLVEILQGQMEKGSYVYRIGGDEFAVISKKWAAGQMESRLERALENAKKLEMDFAYGIVEYKPHEKLEEAIQQADKNMYINKKESKVKAKEMKGNK